jgi:cytochrome c oxidase cbb3-type subunit 3
MSARDERRTDEDAPTEDKVIHSVDDIEEYDNKLPRWWLFTLYGAILFAVVYWYTYHIGNFAETPLAKYESERTQAALAEAKSGTVTPEALVALTRDKATVEAGKNVFVTTCAACHRADGGGTVGPNLTDEFWLHGGTPDKIWKTVAEGVPAKGMPAWKPQLGPDRVQAVTAYVLTLRNTNVPGGKPPQGEREALSANP